MAIITVDVAMTCSEGSGSLVIWCTRTNNDARRSCHGRPRVHIIGHGSYHAIAIRLNQNIYSEHYKNLAQLSFFAARPALSPRLNDQVIAIVRKVVTRRFVFGEDRGPGIYSGLTGRRL